MPVFKKKTDIFTPENKKIRIEKIQKCCTQKSDLCVFANKEKLQNKSRRKGQV